MKEQSKFFGDGAFDMSARLYLIISLLFWCGISWAEVSFWGSFLGKSENTPSTPPTTQEEGWVAPNFNDQKDALGLDSKTFDVPDSLKKAVDFWVKIYTEVRTDQGVIHDVNNLGVIYETVDFTSINQDESLSEREKTKAREKLVESRKDLILEGLQKIATSSEDAEHSDFEKALIEKWNAFGGLVALKEGADANRVRFQLGQCNRMKEAIYLSGRYLPMMEEIFKAQGLPVQLTRIVFVESSFNVLARSKVGASGLWQIMPSAARGRLRMNRVVDLRNHPQEATELAAKMFRFNYEMLGAWPLAITGYNHGPYGVKRLVDRTKSRDLGQIIETGEGRRFGFASRNFYASFLAALEVEGHAEKYFPGINRAKPLAMTSLKNEKPIYFSDLVRAFGGDRDLAQLYNPHLQRLAYTDQVALDSKSLLVVPDDKHAGALEVIAATEDRSDKVEEMKEVLPKTNKKKRHRLASRDPAEVRKYRVLRGDTLYRIARNFRLSVDDLVSLNDLKGPKNIKAGQILRLR